MVCGLRPRIWAKSLRSNKGVTSLERCWAPNRDCCFAVPPGAARIRLVVNLGLQF